MERRQTGLFAINDYYNYSPTSYLCDFVKTRIQRVPLDVICKLINANFNTIVDAVKRITIAIVNPQRNHHLFSGRVLYIKVCQLEAKYKKACEKKRVNLVKQMTCVDCKVVKPFCQLVERHTNARLHGIQRRCFDCDLPLSRGFSLLFREPRSYCFSEVGKKARNM